MKNDNLHDTAHTYYTVERNAQIVLYLLKANNIKRVVASPGATNVTMVASMQQDPWFEMYSAADERSAAYMACGMAAETGEPVVLSCTGATASRNYLPGMTEAFYRKLPILAVTASQPTGRIGSYSPQMIDRTQVQHDVAVFSTTLRTVKDYDDEQEAVLKANQAMMSLRRHGGGPVLLNMETQYAKDYSVKELPPCRVISYYDAESSLPEMDAGSVGIFVGTHAVMSEKETALIDRFCARWNGVVFCDHTSNYHGRYRVEPALVGQQEYLPHPINFDLLVFIGEVSAAYPVISVASRCRHTWRVSRDGEVRSVFANTDAVFEMSEDFFFGHYAGQSTVTAEKTELRDQYVQLCDELRKRVPDDLPLSNAWVAKTLSGRLPAGSVAHFAILNSTRCWDMFPIDATIPGYVNAGGFGIDGCMSAAIGASLMHPDKLYFLFIGDLAFFYDLNAMGNRHVGNNLRILLVNNGKGTEFRNYNHLGARFGEASDEYIAAARHYGNKSHKLVRHYAEDLGFQYLSASSKDEFMKVCPAFLDKETARSMVFEVFTDSQDESDAIYKLNHLIEPVTPSPMEEAVVKAKTLVSKAIGGKATQAVRKMLGK